MRAYNIGQEQATVNLAVSECPPKVFWWGFSEVAGSGAVTQELIDGTVLGLRL